MVEISPFKILSLPFSEMVMSGKKKSYYVCHFFVYIVYLALNVATGSGRQNLSIGDLRLDFIGKGAGWFFKVTNHQQTDCM